MTFFEQLTPLKTNISPENRWLEEDSFPFNMVPFQGHSFIFGRGGGVVSTRSEMHDLTRSTCLFEIGLRSMVGSYLTCQGSKKLKKFQ